MSLQTGVAGVVQYHRRPGNRDASLEGGDKPVRPLTTSDLPGQMTLSRLQHRVLTILNRVHFETVGFLLAGNFAVPYNGLHWTKAFQINDTS